MTKILEMCLSSQVNPFEMGAAFSTLSICLKCYGSWFGAHKLKIELFIEKFLVSQSKDIVTKAAETFVHLQQVSAFFNRKILSYGLGTIMPHC